MKKSLGLLAATLLLSSAAFASDVAQKDGKHTVLKTSRSAQCSTPSGKASRECTRGAGTH